VEKVLDHRITDPRKSFEFPENISPRVIPCHFNTGMTPTLSKFLYILQAVNSVWE
jgi:hypothetical protein